MREALQKNLQKSWLYQLLVFSPVEMMILVICEVIITCFAGLVLYLMLVPDPMIN